MPHEVTGVDLLGLSREQADEAVEAAQVDFASGVPVRDRCTTRSLLFTRPRCTRPMAMRPT
jgi:hypothetical protein